MMRGGVLLTSICIVGTSGIDWSNEISEILRPFTGSPISGPEYVYGEVIVRCGVYSDVDEQVASQTLRRNLPTLHCYSQELDKDYSHWHDGKLQDKMNTRSAVVQSREETLLGFYGEMAEKSSKLYLLDGGSDLVRSLMDISASIRQENPEFELEIISRS